MSEMRNAYDILVGKSEGKEPLVKPASKEMIILKCALEK
jgi:hypothetical protein